jgi:transforming growth factor-beta-induced protein
MTFDSTSLFSSGRRWWVGLCAGLLAGTLVLAGCDNGGGVPTGEDTESLNVHEALSLPQYSTGTLESVLEQTGLDQTLAGAESATVFAPVNSAFATIDTSALDGDLRTRVLNYHVVTGQALSAEDISDGQTVTTAEGSDLTFGVSDGEVTINDAATVGNPNIEAANGVVHLIDQVLLQRTTLNERLDITANLDTLNTALDQAGIAGALDEGAGNGPFTVFAPTDDVVGPYHVNDATLPAGAQNLLASGDLASVLQYHVVGGNALSASDLLGSAGGTQQTLSGASLDIDSTSGGTPTVDGVPVSTADVQVRNGVIHLIDDLLLEQTTIAQRASFTRALDSLTTNVDEAGLAGTLDGSGPFTVFAPTNGAFGAYDDLSPNAALQSKVLTYHVVSGDRLAASDLLSDLRSGGPFTLTTEQGAEIAVDTSDGGAVTLNGRPLISTPDVGASNGVVHVVGDVLVDHLNVVERATVNPSFDVLEQLIGQVGTSSDLTASGPYTVFAPTNQALLGLFDTNGDGAIDGADDLPSNDVLRAILDYHIVSGAEVRSGDIPSGGTTLTTDEGSEVRAALNESFVTLNGEVNVQTADVDVSNGVVHGVGGVLLANLNALQRASVEPGFDLLEQLIERVGPGSLTSDLTGSGPFTVFAPTNQAILDALDSDGDGDIDGDDNLPSDEALRDLLDYHVVSGAEVRSGDVPAGGTTLTTDQGSDLTAAASGGTVTVNDSISVVTPDAGVSNGVIHGVGQVLSIPSGN